MAYKFIKKGLAPVILSAAMVVTSLTPVMAEEPATQTESESAWDISDATVNEITVKLDEKELKVTEYIDAYVANPTNVAMVPNADEVDQKIDIYVPENATASSPIILAVNNGGWLMDAWAMRTVQMKDGDEYASDSDEDFVGAALSRGYVVVSYGGRSRNDNADEDGNYISHSPATMTDTKAVIRYLRYNENNALIGNTDRIVITGTSGGGALSTIIASSGNSADYYESLYEIGAAGIYQNEDGTYESTIGDDVFGTIAYCPINDLREADAAYEFTYQDTRKTLIAEGTAEFQNDRYTGDMLNSALLADQYGEYVNSLNLEKDDGTALTADNLEDSIIELLEAEIEESISEVGIDQMETDVEAENFPASDTTNKYNKETAGDNWDPWLIIEEDGNYLFDYDQFLYNLARNKKLKVPCAFSNAGMNIASQNEDSLFGTEEYPYSAYEFKSWEEDAVEGNGCGLDDTGLTWDEYMETEEGQALALQLKMASPIDYLVSDDDNADSAPYWYVRHGMADRDTSFALQTVLRYAISNNSDVKDLDFEFAWNEPHSGNYDVQEAYSWLDEVLIEETYDQYANTSIDDATVSELTVKLDGEDLNITEYQDAYVAFPTSVASSGQGYTDRYGNTIDQGIDIYVPENATLDSPIILKVNNSGWQSDSWKARTKITDGKEYSSTSDSDAIGAALKRGYIIVTYGCRSRNDAADSEGNYLGHSPATMTDTKAVITYLRYNEIGDTDRIIVTGTSGGGALSTVIAASGNSSDYYKSLWEIGAAGTSEIDGEYYSTIPDDVFATIAYCPINDLREADAAYEWTYSSTRKQLLSEGTAEFGFTLDNQMTASQLLSKQYATYVNGLGLKLDDGTALTASNLEDAIVGLLKDEIEESIEEVGVEQMKTDVDSVNFPSADTTNRYNANSENWKAWLTINDDNTYEFDYDQFLYNLTRNKKLKGVCAFSNKGLGNYTMMNEDSLFGTEEYPYSSYEFYSWNNDAVSNNGCGFDDTGLTWDKYMQTEAGQALALQLKMASPIDYLVSDNANADSAPYWYVRHGMADRDTSFALQTVLRYAISNNSDVKNLDFEFAWNKPHSGDYDVQEAYAWLDAAIEDAMPNIADCDVEISKTSFTFNNKNQKPEIVLYYGGEFLYEGTDFVATYPNDIKSVGTKKVTVEGIGNYRGAITVSYKITKAANKITVKKAKTSKKLKRGKSYKIAAKAKAGKITYKKVSGSKYIKVTSKGKVTLSKKAVKGKTYTAKV